MKKIILLALFCVPFFVSCTKETIIKEGDIIYQYVKERKEIVAKPSDWVAKGVYGESGYRFEAEFPANYITDDVLTNHVVLAYAHYFADEDYILPDIYADEVSGSRYVKILSYKLAKGKITFTLEDSDFKVVKFSDDVLFKIIIIK